MTALNKMTDRKRVVRHADERMKLQRPLLSLVCDTRKHILLGNWEAMYLSNHQRAGWLAGEAETHSAVLW